MCVDCLFLRSPSRVLYRHGREREKERERERERALLGTIHNGGRIRTRSRLHQHPDHLHPCHLSFWSVRGRATKSSHSPLKCLGKSGSRYSLSRVTTAGLFFSLVGLFSLLPTITYYFQASLAAQPTLAPLPPSLTPSPGDSHRPLHSQPHPGSPPRPAPHDPVRIRG